jgi:signal transduction histidine kinase
VPVRGWIRTRRVSGMSGEGNRRVAMKFFSIRNKLISLSTRILILSMFGFFLSSGILKFLSAKKALRDIVSTTESSLIRKGTILVTNNSMALRGMVEDNAFLAVSKLVSATVEKDEDVVYGIYMDNNCLPWVMVDIGNTNEKGFDQSRLSDSVSRWADTVRESNFKKIKFKENEAFEFAAAVYSDSLRRGVIRYGITTAPMLRAVSTLKRDALFDALTFLIMTIALCIVFFLFGTQAMRRQASAITQPLKMLTESADTIAKGDYTTPITICSDDEVGALAGSFEIMRATIKRYTTNLEQMVAERTAQLKAAQKELVEKAHKAGMADIATGTLHNVGNILNSVKTSSQMIDNIMRQTQLESYKRANDLLRQNMATIEEFIVNNPKGKKLLQYYLKLEEALSYENTQIATHVTRLNKKVDTIAEVIAAQQSYAGTSSLTEEDSLADIVDDALTMQTNSLEAYAIKVNKNYHPAPKVLVQKTKLMHILINLLNNAKDAMADMPPDRRTLTITINSDGHGAYIRMQDTGMGIAVENLQKIFSHGYSTKKYGHGFGLHSSANYMTEMHGEMWAESEGLGKGAVFVVKFHIEAAAASGGDVSTEPKENS